MPASGGGEGGAPCFPGLKEPATSSSTSVPRNVDGAEDCTRRSTAPGPRLWRIGSEERAGSVCGPHARKLAGNQLRLRFLGTSPTSMSRRRCRRRVGLAGTKLDTTGAGWTLRVRLQDREHRSAITSRKDRMSSGFRERIRMVAVEDGSDRKCKPSRFAVSNGWPGFSLDGRRLGMSPGSALRPGSGCTGESSLRRAQDSSKGSGEADCICPLIGTARAR